LKQTTEKQLWLNELAVLRGEYVKSMLAIEKDKETSEKKVAAVAKKTKVVGKKQ
jgi:hypothetical protein